MPGSLSVPNTFNTESGNQPASQLDNNFSNIVTYVNVREITQGTLAARPAFGVSGRLYFATDTAQLFADTGVAWTLMSSATGLGGYGVRGLTGLNNAGTPNTKYDLAADLVTLRNPSNGGLIVVPNTGTLTNDTGVAGSTANGRDQAGAFGASNWIHFYFIHNGTTLATLSSLTAPPTGPALPAGYTHWAYATAIRYNATPLLVKTHVRGATVSYDAVQAALSGGAATVETAVALSTLVPPNNLNMSLFIEADLTTNAGGAARSTLTIRSVTTVDRVSVTVQSQVASQDAFNSSLSVFPNIGQQVFYLWQNDVNGGNISARAGTINVQAYSVPNGGE